MATVPVDAFDNRKSVQNLLFGFDGRIDRQWWWLAMLALAAVEVALDPLGNGVVYAAPANSSIMERLLHINGFSADALWFVMFWPTLALQVKRWHDLNKSGFYAILSFAQFPVFLGFSELKLGGPIGSPNVIDFAAAFAGIVGFLTMLVLAFIRGTRGPNKFGLG